MVITVLPLHEPSDKVFIHSFRDNIIHTASLSLWIKKTRHSASSSSSHTTYHHLRPIITCYSSYQENVTKSLITLQKSLLRRFPLFPASPRIMQTMPSGSEAGDNQFDKKSKQLTLTDYNRPGNASDRGTNAIVPDRKPRYTQSKFKEMFRDESIAKPVGMRRSAENLDKNGSAVNAPLLSVINSNAPSAASTYTEYEKPMQPGSQKSSGNGKPKVSDLPPTCSKEEIIEKKAEGFSQERNSAGAKLENLEAGGVAVVDGTKITGVEKEEKQYEGDDELSSGELSNGEEKSG